MKKLMIFLFIVSFALLSNAQLGEYINSNRVISEQTNTNQSDNIIISDSLNFAVLIVDYDTYEFEGGNLSYNQQCDNCTKDSIPFEIFVAYPGDFGSITYNIQNTSETVFYATIIWMGTGQIVHPEDFSQSYPFNPINNLVEKPENIEYYNIYGTKVYTDSSFIQSADSAWQKIESLEITKQFAEYNYKAAIYLYPPTVGMFSPAAAKWIIFFYLNDFNSSVNPISSIKNQPLIFPNPCKDHLIIENLPNNNDNCYLEILDLSGRLMIEKQIHSFKKKKVDVRKLDNGMYILMIYNNKSVYNSVFIKG